MSADHLDPAHIIQPTAAPPRTEAAFVSRAGVKLSHALTTFDLDLRDLRCADFGCNVGGFTDCMLQRGAASVIAIDTGYGTLAWKLRQDPRVTVRERTNALHAPPPTAAERPEFIAIDLGWTPQRLCIPAALTWLVPRRGNGSEAHIVTLIKPHYEATTEEKLAMTDGVLPADLAWTITARVLSQLPALGVNVLAHVESPIEGGGGKGNAHGNHEWLALLSRRVATKNSH